MSEKVEMFRCNGCRRGYPTEYEAERCEFEHHRLEFEQQRLEFANYMLEQGESLGSINLVTDMPRALPDELRKVTKDTLFKISYLQCNDKYVYKACNVYDDAVDVQNSEDYHIFRIGYDDLIRGMKKNVD